jgi:hypothetical protein
MVERCKESRTIEGRKESMQLDNKRFHLIQVCFLLLNLKDHDLQNKYSDIKQEIRTMNTPL